MDETETSTGPHRPGDWKFEGSNLALNECTRYRLGMIQVKLLAFAHAASQLGWREMLAECSPSETPRGLFERFAPGFDPGTARVAVDCEYCSWDDAIGPVAQEVAMLPPVSGG